MLKKRIVWIVAKYEVPDHAPYVRYTTPILARTVWGAKRKAQKNLTPNERSWPGKHIFDLDKSSDS